MLLEMVGGLKILMYFMSAQSASNSSLCIFLKGFAQI